MAHYIITGGGSGIGRALAKALDKRDEKVVLIGRREQALLETAKLLSHESIVISADLGKEDDRAEVLSKLKPLSLKAIIHNAATVEPFGPLAELSLDKWRDIMAINVEAPLFLTRELLPNLKGARVLMLSSGARHLSIPSMIPYCMSKEMVYRLYQGFMAEQQDVIFSTVCPGVVETPMMEEIISSEKLKANEHNFYQGLRDNAILLTPELVANFLTWLLLDVPAKQFSAKEWDIYDAVHHEEWLQDKELKTIPE